MTKRPTPTRINGSCIRGALSHYESITDAEARALGVTALPGPRQGQTSRQPGIRCRRLKGGRLNCVADFSTPAGRATGFDDWLERLKQAVTLSAGADPASH